MSDFNKSKEELLVELQNLKSENESLKKLYKNDISNESERKYRLIFEAAGDAIFIISGDGDVLEVNPLACERLGYTREELLKIPLSELDMPEFSRLAPERIAKLMELGQISFETEHRRKDGSSIPTEVNSKLIEWDGKPAIMCICRDISERKRAEEELQKKENRYSLLLNNLNAGIVVHAPNTSIILNNPRASELLGLNDEQMRGKLAIDPRWKFLYANGTPLPLAEYPVNQILKTNNIIKNQIFGVNRPDTNDIIWLTVNGFPVFDRDGKISEIVVSFMDITERKIAEEKLIESENLFSLFMDYLPAIVFLKDKDGKTIFVNKYMDDELGASKWMGKTMLDIFPNDFGKKLVADDMRVMELGYEKIEESVPSIDGIFHYYETQKFLINRNDQEPLLGGISLDITERKQAEEALREINEKLAIKEKRLSLALSATSDAIWEWNYVTGKTYYSYRWYEMLGYNDQEFEMSFDTFKTLCHPDDFEPTIEKISYVLENPESKGYNAEFRMKHKDGSWVWIMGRGNVVKRNEAQKPLLLTGTNTDISERKKIEEAFKESEEKLSSLFASMTEMVVLHELVFDDKGEAVNYRIIDCNNAFCSITGISKEKAIGYLATEVYQTESAPYIEEYKKVALSGMPFEYDTYYPPMDKHFAISVVSPKKNHFATITTDITAIKQIQEVISEKNKELENYLYVASHDLRSPLVNIQGFSQRFKKNVDTIQNIISTSNIDENTQESLKPIFNEIIPKTLDYIFTNVTKMDFLINGLLQISRTGRVVMSIQQINMNELFESIFNSKKFQFAEISATVNISDLPPCYGDENLLNQLFSNLLANALNYRDANRTLVIDITATSQYNKIIYSIKDNGIGIAKRHKDKVWDVFFRVNPAISETSEGLGLSIVKRIIDKHKGKVWVESEEGKGSIFYVELQKNHFVE